MRIDLGSLVGLGVVVLALAFVSGPHGIRGAEETPPPTDVPLEIPEAERIRPNPIPASPEAIERGGLYFASQCTMCHGKKGDGKGDLVDRLKLEVPDFTRPEFHEEWTDGALFYIITKGHGRMKGEGERLPDDWKWEMIHYIRSLAP